MSRTVLDISLNSKKEARRPLFSFFKFVWFLQFASLAFSIEWSA